MKKSSLPERGTIAYAKWSAQHPRAASRVRVREEWVYIIGAMLFAAALSIPMIVHSVVSLGRHSL